MPRLRVTRSFGRSSDLENLSPPPPPPPPFQERATRPIAGSLYQRRHKRHSWHQYSSSAHHRDTNHKIDKMTIPASSHQMHQTSDSQAEGPLQDISACRCQAHESHEYTTLFNGRLPRLGAESGAFYRPSPDFAQWIAISIAGVLTVVLAVGIYVIARFYNVSLDGSRGPDRKRRAPKFTGKQTGMDCYLNDDSAVMSGRKMRWPNSEDHHTMANLEAGPSMNKSDYHDPSQKTALGTRTMEHETWRRNKRVHIRKSIAKEEEAFGKSLSPRIANRESRSAKGLNSGTTREELRQRHFDTTAS